MNRKRLCILALGALALGMTSCNHKVNYFVANSDIWEGSEMDASVRVTEFIDQTPEDKKINVRIAGESWRMNGDDGYASEPLSAGVTRAFTHHLKESGLFREVLGPEDEGEADFTLSANLFDYSAMGRVKRTPELGVIVATAVANVPGAALSLAATSRMKTDVQSSIEFRDFALTENSSGARLFHEPAIGRQIKRRTHWARADAPQLYYLADNELRQLTNHLIEEMAEAFQRNYELQTGQLATTVQPGSLPWPAAERFVPPTLDSPAVDQSAADWEAGRRVLPVSGEAEFDGFDQSGLPIISKPQRRGLGRFFGRGA